MMSVMGDASVGPKAVLPRLRALARALRCVRALRGLVLWSAATALVLAALVALLEQVPRYAAIAPYLAAGLTSLALLLWVALVLVPALRPVSLKDAARLVEGRFPQLQDGLLTLVDPAPEFVGSSMQETGHPRRSLTDLLTLEVSRRLEALDLRTALDLPGLRRLALAALPLLLTAALITAACPVGLARLTGPGGVDQTQRPALRRPVLPPELEQVGLRDLSVEVEPPTYSGLPEQTLHEDFTSLEVLRGSRVTIRATVDADATAVLEIGQVQASGLRGPDLSRSFTATENLQWTLTAQRAGKQVSVGPYRLRVTEDKPPTVRLVEPGRDLVLDRLEPLRLVLSAEDDFGVAALRLQYRRAGERTWRSLEVAGGERHLNVAFQWDLAPMALRPGEAIEYRAVAQDTDVVSGPKTAATSVFRVGLKSLPPLPPTPATVEKAQTREEDALANLKTEAAAFDQQLQEMIRQAQQAESSGSSGQVSRGELQEAQQRLAGRAEDLRQAMAEAERLLAESPLLSDDLVQKVQELHKLMSELMNEDLKRVMERVQEALKQVDPAAMRSKLEQAREAQRVFMEKLDRTLSLLRKAKLEAQLEALQRFADQLAREQQLLQERTEKLEEGQRSQTDIDRERRLSQGAAPLPKQVKDAGQEMLAENEALAAQLRALAEDLQRDDPSGAMRQAAAEMQRGKPGQAQPLQAKAQAALRDAAARLAGAAADLTAQERRELTGATRGLVRDAISLSDSQEQVLTRTRPLAEQGRADLTEQKLRLSAISQGQEAVRRGTEGLAANVRRLSRRSPIVGPELVASADRLVSQMAQARSEVEAGQAGLAYARQRDAMTGLNELAQQLMHLSDQMNQTTAQMALQEYLRRLEELAQRQEALNQQSGNQSGGQTQAGAGEGAEGQQPMPGAGPGDMGQLAMEQAMIRQALQKLLGGQGAGNLADRLGGVPGQMQKVEDDLRGRKITPQTLQQQRDILHKMLDAQRSLYSKDKESRERKAEAPRPYKPPKAPPVLRPDLMRPTPTPQRRQDLGSSELPLDYEAITRAYLERLRR